jgi:hypothetical protein
VIETSVTQGGDPAIDENARHLYVTTNALGDAHDVDSCGAARLHHAVDIRPDALQIDGESGEHY